MDTIGTCYFDKGKSGTARGDNTKNRNPEATRDAFRDGWFCSGDIAVLKNGMFYIVDRKKVESFQTSLHLQD